MKKSIYISQSPQSTRTLGVRIAKALFRLPLKNHALVVSLEGELGSGKTTFSQGFAKGLGIKERVLSPTFLIVRKFRVPFTSRLTKFQVFYHIDCYRLKNSKELLELGWKEMVENPRAILLIEWGNRVHRILPKHTLRISFKEYNSMA